MGWGCVRGRRSRLHVALRGWRRRRSRRHGRCLILWRRRRGPGCSSRGAAGSVSLDALGAPTSRWMARGCCCVLASVVLRVLLLLLGIGFLSVLLRLLLMLGILGRILLLLGMILGPCRLLLLMVVGRNLFRGPFHLVSR